MGRVRRGLRLALAMQRLELAILLGACLLLAVAMLAIAWQTRVVRTDELACYAAAPPAIEGSPELTCPEFLRPRDILQQLAFAAVAGGMLAPIVLGLFLGVPIVAREVESRTAAIAWTLSASRPRWLALRAAPIAVVVLIAAAAAGIAAEVMVRALPWNEGVAHTFESYGGRGPLVPLRALAVLGIAIAVGAIVPRQLPALLLGGGLVVGGWVGLAAATEQWLADAAVPVPVDEAQGATRVYEQWYRIDATGQIVGWDAFYAEYPLAAMGEEDLPPGYTMMLTVVRPAAYDGFVARESAILLGVAGVAFAASGLAVRRLRP